MSFSSHDGIVHETFLNNATGYYYIKSSLEEFTQDFATFTENDNGGEIFINEGEPDPYIEEGYHENWDPRNRRELEIDGSPIPAGMGDTGKIAINAPEPRGRSWFEWLSDGTVNIIAGSRGDFVDQTINFGYGFGDGVTFGATKAFRDMTGYGEADENSWAYFGGGLAAELIPAPTAIASKGTAVWKLYNKFNEAGECASLFTKLVHGGCFVAGTEVTVESLPQCSSMSAALWDNSDWVSQPQTDWFEGDANSSQAASYSSNLLESPPTLRVAIEDVPLGSRIPTKNPRPWERDDSLAEPEQSSWALLSITMYREDGGVVDAEILRPRSWIERNGFVAGQTISLNVTELEVTGEALVNSISDCPPIAPGEGSVVTARFVTRQVDVIARVSVLGVNGEIEVIEGTTIHPIWSVDRQVWVEFGDLQPGESLQVTDGIAESALF